MTWPTDRTTAISSSTRNLVARMQTRYDGKVPTACSMLLGLTTLCCSRFTLRRTIACRPAKARSGEAADLYTSIRKDGDMKKAGTIIYAVGWTATLLWHSNHTYRGDAAAASRQRGPRGRWRQRVARALQHSGCHGHGRSFRHFARLSESSDRPRTTSFDSWMKRITPTTLEARPVGFVQLLWQHAEIRGQLYESSFWGRGH